MLPTVISFLVAILAVVVFLFARPVVLRWMIEYRRDPDAVRVVVFRRFPIVTIPYHAIVEVRRVSSDEVLVPRSGVMLAAIRVGNRWTREAVLIVRRKGLRRGVVITPERPDEFVADVRARAVHLRAEEAKRGES